MLWKAIHDTLKWIGITFFPAIVAILGTSAALAQGFPETKPWFTAQWQCLLALMSNWSFWMAGALVFIAWLTAFVYSAHKLSEYDQRTGLPDPEDKPEKVTEPQMAPLGNIHISDIKVMGRASLDGFTIVIEGYNGNNETLEFSGLRGVVRIVMGPGGPPIALPPPSVLHGPDLEPQAAFHFALQQSLTQPQADRILMMLTTEEFEAALNFRKLDLNVHSKLDRNRWLRLPMDYEAILKGVDHVTSAKRKLPEH